MLTQVYTCYPHLEITNNPNLIQHKVKSVVWLVGLKFNPTIKVLKKVVTNSLFNKNLTIRIMSMTKNRFFKISILLIIIGIILSIVILTIYGT